ncbi:formylglycine-generating enzyme family protein [Nostoc sp. 'Peltigera membranacea cyanobiont' 210A]|uniref:formylglycine-generating enzyme family protein n=1 Tax=Nostoc sp. 'Peltigera membranacea cyanobiont' 210A TaxID=2014529 RepID=UPI001CB92274|nr:formylglycine-generating enzyme family protein [Nostoc sp. 'Peltigera membranacea cyanobiont' 210A]
MRTQEHLRGFASSLSSTYPLNRRMFSLSKLEEEHSTATTVFEFEIITVNGQEKENFQRHAQAQFFCEKLDSGERLEMVAIPGGTFLMGAPEAEVGRDTHEGPQHIVTVAPFFMSKYPVTQAQWRFVAALPQINRPLAPAPADFKGDNRPVERVSWYDAVEFCARLAQLTGRKYRLPSEAEWEYACRAGTTTPFYFGKTTTTELANYDGRFIYSYEANTPSSPDSLPSSPPPSSPPPTCPISGFGYSCSYSSHLTSITPDFGYSSNHQISIKENRFSFQGNYRGKSREQTTPVGSFQKANAFGLYDMHGNVWEWCADHWYDNYQEAPLDGSVWLSDDENQYRVMRGGSWINYSELCRAASRAKGLPYDLSYYIGFRVVCALD